MLTHQVHVFLALVMVVLGGVNAWLMLEAFGGRTPKEASRRRAAMHRWIGRTFVVIYLVLLVSMVRMALEHGELDAVEAVHAAVGMSLLPVLAVKILIVRRYPPLQGVLPLLGSLVLVLTVVAVGLGVLAGRGPGAALEAAEAQSLPDHPGRAPFVQYCGQCHALSRPLGLARRERPDEARWTGLVDEMRQRAASRGRATWTPEEGQAIVGFLVAVGQGGAASGAGDAGGAAGGDDRGRGRGRGRGGDDR